MNGLRDFVRLARFDQLVHGRQKAKLKQKRTNSQGESPSGRCVILVESQQRGEASLHPEMTEGKRDGDSPESLKRLKLKHAAHWRDRNLSDRFCGGHDRGGSGQQAGERVGEKEIESGFTLREWKQQWDDAEQR